MNISRLQANCRSCSRPEISKPSPTLSMHWSPSTVGAYGRLSCYSPRNSGLVATRALRALSRKLQTGAKNRASGLFSAILMDRNDSTFPFDSFYLKCHNSAAQFPEWLSAYLLYRALDAFPDFEQNMPRILTADLTSSVIDYYEAVIFCLDYIRSQDAPVGYAEAALSVAKSLENLGVKDTRLHKIRISLKEDAPIAFRGPPTQISNDGLSILVAQLTEKVFSEAPKPNGNSHIDDIEKNIFKVDVLGSTAQQASAQLISLGINFKSLAIGKLIALKASNSSRALSGGPILPTGADLVLPLFSAAEIFVNSEQRISSLLKSISAATPCLGNPPINNRSQKWKTVTRPSPASA